MSTPRFYHPGNIASSVHLENQAAHHALRVLRLKAGHPVILFNGEGGEYHGVISACNKNSVSVAIAEFRAVERESPLWISLAQGISSGENMDFTVQKAVELGVSRIQPLATQKAVVRLNDERAEKRVQHWQRVVISACEQCGRNRIPTVEEVATLDEWLNALVANDSQSRLLLSPGSNGSFGHLHKADRVVLLCGPEGGFTEEEENAAEAAGFVKVKLGPRILRTETAAIAALTAMQVRWGDL